MPADALTALLGLQSAQAPMLGLEDMRQRRLREMQRNIELAQGNPHMAVGATPSDVSALQQDITTDPNTGDEQRALVAYNRPEQVQARETTRQDALAKLLLPEKLKGKNALDLEKLRGDNALATAQAKADQAGGAADLFTPEGQQVAADFFGASGKMIPGMTRSPQSIAGVVNYLGQTQPNINVAANEAAYQASKGSLGKLQATQDAASSFIDTADANAARLIDSMSKAPGIGIPLFDKPIRAGARVLGSTTMAALDAIRQSVSREYSRILNSPTLGGVVTQSERDAMDAVLSENASPSQIVSAIAQLKAEAQNRLNAYQERIGAVQGRIGGIGGGAAAPAPKQYLSGSGWE